MDQILLGLAKLAPVIGTLVVGIYYLFNKEKKYVEQIEALNKELRTNERDTLDIISKLTVTLDKLVENDSVNKTEIINEFKTLREIITTKIDSIKK
jgi:hypothetical protein